MATALFIMKTNKVLSIIILYWNEFIFHIHTTTYRMRLWSLTAINLKSCDCTHRYLCAHLGGCASLYNFALIPSSKGRRVCWTCCCESRTRSSLFPLEPLTAMNCQKFVLIWQGFEESHLLDMNMRLNNPYSVYQIPCAGKGCSYQNTAVSTRLPPIALRLENQEACHQSQNLEMGKRQNPTSRQRVLFPASPKIFSSAMESGRLDPLRTHRHQRSRDSAVPKASRRMTWKVRRTTEWESRHKSIFATEKPPDMNGAFLGGLTDATTHAKTLVLFQKRLQHQTDSYMQTI